MLDQEAPKARAIHEQIPLYNDAIIHGDGGDKAGFAMQSDIIDLAFDPYCAALLRIGAQIFGITAGIEMIGVIDRGQVVALVIFSPSKAAIMGGHGFDVEDLDRPFVACLFEFVPDMVEGHAIDLIAIITKRVDVAVANLAPIDELNAKFEAALHGRQHLCLVNFQQTVEVEEGGNGGFANANCADLF